MVLTGSLTEVCEAGPRLSVDCGAKLDWLGETAGCSKNTWFGVYCDTVTLTLQH